MKGTSIAHLFLNMYTKGKGGIKYLRYLRPVEQKLIKQRVRYNVCKAVIISRSTNNTKRIW